MRRPGLFGNVCVGHMAGSKGFSYYDRNAEDEDFAPPASVRRAFQRRFRCFKGLSMGVKARKQLGQVPFQVFDVSRRRIA